MMNLLVKSDDKKYALSLKLIGKKAYIDFLEIDKGLQCKNGTIAIDAENYSFFFKTFTTFLSLVEKLHFSIHDKFNVSLLSEEIERGYLVPNFLSIPEDELIKHIEN